MGHKFYIKPPAPTTAMLKAQIVLASVFLPLGGVFVFIAEGEARPFVAIFALVWVIACIALIVYSAKALKLVKTGKIEIAEIDDSGPATTVGDFAQRLRDLEALKNEGLLSPAEYQKKRKEIMQDKW